VKIYNKQSANSQTLLENQLLPDQSIIPYILVNNFRNKIIFA